MYLTHNHSYTRVYKTWSDMLQRCNNPKRENYPRYGGRGIKVCKRWYDFQNFLTDMGERPKGRKRQYSIERKNNDKGYNKNNCIWATKDIQNKNKITTNQLTATALAKSSGYGVAHVLRLKETILKSYILKVIIMNKLKRHIFKKSAINYLIKRRKFYTKGETE